MTTNHDGADHSEDNHQGEGDRAGDEDEDQPNTQMTQHHGKWQEYDNNDKDLHYLRTNKWLEDEQRMGWQYKDEAQAQWHVCMHCLGPM